MPAGINPEPREFLKRAAPFTYQIEEYISLPSVNKNFKSSFFKVINSRKSERKFSKLTQEQISNLLWYSSKVKSISLTSDNNILSHRNAPSAGSIHPIDIFVSPPSDFEKRRLYYYDPFTHKLAKINFQKKIMQLFFKHVNNNLNIYDTTLIWFGVSIKRTEYKYKNPESLVWRDAGALIMLFQLVATALQIKSCPIGTLANPYFSNLFEKDNKLISGGGMLFG